MENWNKITFGCILIVFAIVVFTFSLVQEVEAQSTTSDHELCLSLPIDEVNAATGHPDVLTPLSMSPSAPQDPGHEYTCMVLSISITTGSGIGFTLFTFDSTEHAIEKFTTLSQDKRESPGFEIKEDMIEKGGWISFSGEMKEDPFFKFGQSIILSQKDRYVVTVTGSPSGDDGPQVDLSQLPEITKIIWEKVDGVIAVSEKGEEEPSEIGETVGVEDELQVSTSMGEVMSPLKQMKSGVDPKDVVCKEGLVLMLKSTDGSAACVKDLSSSKLIERGWGILA